MAISCSTCPHAKSCFASHLDNQGQRRLEDAFQRCAIHGKGKVVFHQGQPAHFYYLCHGSVKLTSLLENGEEIILDVLSAPSVLSVRSQPRSTFQHFSAVSLTSRVEITHVGFPLLLEIVKEYSSAGERLFLQFNERTEKSYQTVARMRLSVRERILSLIALNFLEQGVSTTTVPLSSYELAQWVQTTPETISRILRWFRTEGLIKVNGKGAITFRSDVLGPYLGRY